MVNKAIRSGRTVFSRVILNDLERMDFAAARRDVVEAARGLVDRNPDIGAIVLECTNMSPFARDIQGVAGVPVATPYRFVCWFQSLIEPRRFPDAF